MKTYKINEIFYSIQGEGGYAGTPMVFVRFSGCNLNCPWCDTQHQQGKDMTAYAIMDEVKAIAPRKIPVCFTGGEPTLQVDEKIKNLFIEENHPLYLETNGIAGLYGFFGGYKCVTVSPKNTKIIIEPKYLEGVFQVAEESELKIVFDTQNPELGDIIQTWGQYNYTRKFIQPLTNKDGSTNVEDVVEFIKQNPKWRLSVQLQRILNFK